MRLSRLLYCPLMEEDKQLIGWSKSTIDFVTQNKPRIYKSIRGIVKNINSSLNHQDIDDIYQEVINYMYGCDDYDVYKAYERSSSGVIVSLDGYVHSCIKFCVRRYATKSYNNDRNVVHDTIREEGGKELSIFDSIADKHTDEQFSSSSYNLEEACKDNEYKRYRFGVDIFMIFYIRLVLEHQHKSDKYKEVLTIFGISSKDVDRAHREANRDGMALELAKGVSAVELDEAIRIIGNYTYSADKIVALINLF